MLRQIPLLQIPSLSSHSFTSSEHVVPERKNGRGHFPDLQKEQKVKKIKLTGPAFAAVAEEPVLKVDALAVVGAGVGDAVVDLGLAVFAGKSDGAAALVSGHEVHADLVVGAPHAVALVDVVLAAQALESWIARKGKTEIETLHTFMF